MYTQITPDLIYVGAENRRLSLFESVYPVPRGMTYNAYLITDEKTALLDTVDADVADVFMDNVENALAGRTLDYLVVHHMEPDHAATIVRVMEKYPQAMLITSGAAKKMLEQFFEFSFDGRIRVVTEGDELALGKHTLCFATAPMVHWPEVLVSFDKKDDTLFSADAFGTFGAPGGSLFADEAALQMDEYRRYFINIVGKYGAQTQALLKKAAALPIRMLCPLHGPIWRKDFVPLIEKYDTWSRYAPEGGTVIFYASVYGHTENAAQILSSYLSARGVTGIQMYDVSRVELSVLVAEAFRADTVAFCAPTYNGGTFIKMDQLLRDLAEHNFQNRRVALVENGSWAPRSALVMRTILDTCKDITYIEPVVTLHSSVKSEDRENLMLLAEHMANR